MCKSVTVALSVGTALLAVFLTIVLSVAIVLAASVASPEDYKPHPKLFEPKVGAVGELNRLKNDIEYGPVNIQAAKEVKDGLFANIRARRMARQNASVACAPQQQWQASQVCRVIDPSDCTACYTTTTAPVVVQSTALAEYPATKPIESPSIAPANCPDGKCPLVKPTAKPSARMEAKTGAFVCSHCRKPCVGNEWHTDWQADGTPTTFLCRSCNASMNEQQKSAAFDRYEMRQAKHVNGTLHQEISQ